MKDYANRFEHLDQSTCQMRLFFGTILYSERWPTSCNVLSHFSVQESQIHNGKRVQKSLTERLRLQLISMYPRGKGGKSHTADVPPGTLDDHFVPPQDEDRCLRGRVIDCGRRWMDGRVIMEKTESTAMRPRWNRIWRRNHYFHARWFVFVHVTPRK